MANSGLNGAWAKWSMGIIVTILIAWLSFLSVIAYNASGQSDERLVTIMGIHSQQPHVGSARLSDLAGLEARLARLDTRLDRIDFKIDQLLAREARGD